MNTLWSLDPGSGQANIRANQYNRTEYLLNRAFRVDTSVPELLLSERIAKRLSRNSSSRPSPPPADARRDPDNVPAKAGNQRPNDVIVVFWIPDLAREAALVRNDGFGEL